MRLTTVFLVHLSSKARPAARAAARRAFPEAEIAEVATLEEARRGPPRPPELLVLGEPDAAAAARAVQQPDAAGRPRWAVVSLGGDAADLADTVPPAEWEVPLLARVFRSAVLQHELGVENQRLQGDLKTVARRISHDLGAPLGCIGTAAHVVKVSVAPAALRPVAPMIENIEESAREISQILERVNLVLRASGYPPDPARLAMGGVVAGVLRQLEPAIAKTGAVVREPTAWPEVTGVARWLEIIWWNLLQNALQHGGPAPRVELGTAPEEEADRFSIADHGAAILPVIAARFFQPFDQLHLRPGTGLGLSIVQRLVALQGGRCGYERRPDGSSVFFFTIPRPAAGRRPRAASSDVQAVAGGG